MRDWRVIIGSLLNAIYNRGGAMKGRALFLLDEVARLGYMRILETGRDAGRKYGITLTMIYQSIGQLRETYGGRDASSKWSRVRAGFPLQRSTTRRQPTTSRGEALDFGWRKRPQEVGHDLTFNIL